MHVRHALRSRLASLGPSTDVATLDQAIAAAAAAESDIADGSEVCE